EPTDRARGVSSTVPRRARSEPAVLALHQPVVVTGDDLLEWTRLLRSPACRPRRDLSNLDLAVGVGRHRLPCNTIRELHRAVPVVREVVRESDDTTVEERSNSDRLLVEPRLDQKVPAVLV